MHQRNRIDDTSELYETMLAQHVRNETSRRIKRLAGLYATAGGASPSIPAHVLTMIEADARAVESDAIDGPQKAGAAELVDIDALTEHALMVADGKNGYRFWWGMAWNKARDMPTWWPEAA